MAAASRSDYFLFGGSVRLLRGEKLVGFSGWDGNINDFLLT